MTSSPDPAFDAHASDGSEDVARAASATQAPERTNVRAIGQPTARSLTLPAPFAGYPYLVTRIGRTPLRHMAILPADWPRERLIDLARRQAAANQLGTCVCLGPEEAVFITSDGGAEDSSIIPIGIPVIERLALVDRVRETTEVASRRRALNAYERSLNPGGYLVGDGLEGGRPATAEEIDRLARSGADGVPAGLARCPTCGRHAGDFLAVNGEGDGDLTPRVVAVHCRCQNPNRCAGCGEPLAASRLSAYEYDESDGTVWYAAAYMALWHRCHRVAAALWAMQSSVDRGAT